jgi:pimeloyl-ACP methyl ester carboxylesterase
MASDAAAFIRALGFDQVDLFGFSMGGMIGQVIAQEEPGFVMKGQSDKMLPSKNAVDLDRRLPNSQLILYPDAGHGGVFQFHEDFVKRTLEFL